MKRLVAMIMAVLMLWSGTAVAANTGAQIDGAALEWYAQAITELFYSSGVPISMTTDDLDGDRTLLAHYDAEDSRSTTIEEALTADEPPADLVIVYYAYDDSITFMFDRQLIAEIPEAVEIYADGQRMVGDLHVASETVNDETTITGFWFSLDEIETMLAAEYSFMRLVTDKNTYFIEMTSDNMLIPYCMLALICDGICYTRKDSEFYLDETVLLEEIRGWQPKNASSAQAATNTQPLAFQVDYEAIDKAAKSAFLLEVYDANDRLLATGSGFVAFDKSTMITNEHVIEDGAYVIAYSDQYRSSYKLTELKAVDAEADIAILKFDESANIQPLLVDSNARLLRGQPVTAIGSPQGVLNTVSSGNISNIVYYSDEIPDYIQFTAPISPGSSGGALFNEQGAVIGLCVSYLKEGQSMYYAIPIKYVEALYKEAMGKQPTTLMAYNGLDVITPKLTITKDGIQVSWDAVPGAEGYIVYRRLADNRSAFQQLYSGTKTVYLDKTAKHGRSYEYRIGVKIDNSSRMSEIVGITRPTATPKPTSTPAAFKVNTTVKANKGEYTISWTGGSSAPYRITYSLSSGSGETYSDSGIYGSSYTTAWMIPGKEYKVTITNSKGVSASGKVKVPSASSFRDGTITAGKVGIQVSPRRDSDGSRGSGGPVYVQSLIADEMTTNIRQKGWSYGLYYRFDLPSFSGSRTYMQMVVFRAPNGYSYIWDTGRYEFSYLGSDSWWKWDIIGEDFFQSLVDKYRRVPVGQYYVDLYWNGMLVNSKAFQVK